MRKLFLYFTFSLLLPGLLILAAAPAVPAQHEGHQMPGTPGSKPTPTPPPQPIPLAKPSPLPSPPLSKDKHVHPSETDKVSASPSPPQETEFVPAEPAHMHGDETKETDSDLLVISGEQMGIRIGLSSNIAPMGKMGSGTSWQPASTPMYMLHKSVGEWLLMFHYNAVIGANAQGGPRGVTKFESANWFMSSGVRRFGIGTLELRGMFSLEPFTFARGGSPLLFQTGETFEGQPLIDRQHPHDLFMELSGSYVVPLSDRATWFAYLGYPGEPALGPTAFMHRISASENPSAPLSHHLQDSSHISFGVFTTGFTYRWFKLEGSVFNGREPDENRYNFEAHPWNSRSARLTFAPNDNWSLQVSHGFLREPEALQPGNVRRTTASITYNKPIAHGNWATSLIWGRNHESHDDEIFNLNGYIAESTVNFRDKNYLYTRLELVDKNQLLRSEDRQLLGIKDHHPSFRIGAYTFGGARDIWIAEKLSLAVGGDVTFYSKPATLDSIYGANPASYRIFVRLRPSKMTMKGHGVTHGGIKP